jgi:hypothetical protein
MAPGVAAALKELYPGDLATGYAVGDLRGAISVKVLVEYPPFATAERLTLFRRVGTGRLA